MVLKTSSFRTSTARMEFQRYHRGALDFVLEMAGLRRVEGAFESYVSELRLKMRGISRELISFPRF